MNYEEFIGESLGNFDEMPQEKSEMYKKNFIKIPEEYLLLKKKREREKWRR